MNSKTSCIRCLVFSLLLCTGKLHAQGMQSLLFRADSLLAAGEVYQANTLYRRLEYFSDSTQHVYIHKQLAHTYKRLDSFGYAFYYSKRLIYEDADSAADTWAMEAFANGLASHDPDDWNDLLKLEGNIAEEGLSKPNYLRFVFYRALLDIRLNKQHAAVIELQKLYPYLHTADSIALEVLTADYKKHGMVNTTKARNLSLVFPGLGQFYLRKPKSAVNSIIVNGVIVSGLVITAVNYTWADGLLFWAIPLNHYYIGGARAAEELGKQKQTEVTAYYYNAFIGLLTKAEVRL